MKYAMRLFGVVLAMMMATPLTAQGLKVSGFAGKDQELYFVPSQSHPSKTIFLGSDDPATRDKDCQFWWKILESPNDSENDYQWISQDVYNPQFRAFVGGDYVVQATRVSKYGYQTETVCVTLASEVKLVKATTKIDCWSNGDAVHPSNFEFETSPPNYDYLVEVRDDDQIIGASGNWFGDEEIHFKIRTPETDEYTDCEETAEIYVSTGDWYDLSFGVPKKGGFSKYVEDLETGIKKLKEAKSVLTNAANKGKKFQSLISLVEKANPAVTRYVEVKPRTQVNFHNFCINMSCCQADDGTIAPLAFIKTQLELDIGVDITGRFPLYPPIPNIGLQLVLKLTPGVKANGVLMLTYPSKLECVEASLQFTAGGEFSIGADVVLLDPDILRVGVAAYGGIKGSTKLSFLPRIDFAFQGITVNAGIKADATVVGFNHEFFNVSFGQWTLVDK